MIEATITAAGKMKSTNKNSIFSPHFIKSIGEFLNNLARIRRNRLKQSRPIVEDLPINILLKKSPRLLKIVIELKHPLVEVQTFSIPFPVTIK